MTVLCRITSAGCFRSPKVTTCSAWHEIACAVLGQDDDRSIPLGICSRMFERLTQFFITILERGSSFLMTQLTDLLQLYMDRGLLSVTAAEIQQMRPKRTYLMLRILCIFMVVTDSYMLIGKHSPHSYSCSFHYFEIDPINRVSTHLLWLQQSHQVEKLGKGSREGQGERRRGRKGGGGSRILTKSRQCLTRFCPQIPLRVASPCQFLRKWNKVHPRHDWKSNEFSSFTGENGPQVEEAKDRARSALNEIYNGSQTAHVLAALVSKYLAITDRELQLWQASSYLITTMTSLPNPGNLWSCQASSVNAPTSKSYPYSCDKLTPLSFVLSAWQSCNLYLCTTLWHTAMWGLSQVR